MADADISELVEAWAAASPDNMEKLVLALQKARNKTAVGVSPVEHANFLVKVVELYETETSFKKGDLVTWKDGLRDRLHPESGWPAIVLDVFIDPIIDPVQDTQSPTFRREFDLLCGVVVGGVMYTYYFESRRMRKFEGSAEGL